MKVRGLFIENFRAIASLSMENLEDTVVIAGPNGCGESCIFDALRLSKSIYGGYQPNEWHQWFSEFQININNLGRDVTALFQDKGRQIRIWIDFELTETEREFITANSHEIVVDLAWKSILPDRAGRRRNLMPAADMRRHQPEVDAETIKRQSALKSALENSLHRAEICIDTTGDILVEPSPVLELCFSTFEPENIGIIDYHGANRQFERESMGGINLNIDETGGRYKSHAMYSYSEKYKNIKSELAAAYVKDLISAQSDASFRPSNSLNESLKDLFRTFFPGKVFLGPKPTPDGHLSFSVELENGALHDINDLSSGEKEILYGYLRLKNTAPRNSVVLLDEPELHLNPRLVKGLPRFYQKYIGEAKNNQIWLATHSDAFLRSAVGEPGFSVFHMRSPIEAARAGAQIGRVSAHDEGKRPVSLH